mmetsp:Transcript_53001/g.77668  ORF Transcript_53001/g.77668 Transcript_53001/m.77668 type:complete len:475 (-) Transcript_53001:354-1778(-)
MVGVGNGDFHVFTRWGRVGDDGTAQLSGATDRENAEKEFKSKFKSKTANNWDSRVNFVVKKGKYELIEHEGPNESTSTKTKTAPASSSHASAVAAAPPATQGKSKGKGEDNIKGKGVQCESRCERKNIMEDKTKSLVEWILDADMFKSAMRDANIDVDKMPLGNISQTQVAKGFKVLKEIDEAFKQSPDDEDMLTDLSGKFYQIVPHAFGRKRPQVINTQELLKQKFDLVAMLGDIEVAQRIQEEAGKGVDDKYDSLKTELTCLHPENDVFKKIQKYASATMDKAYYKCELLDVWSCEREGEAEGFKEFDKLNNRRLLWHGTNIAVVAAILKNGLKIMPTASCGSRVGRGIYLASEHSKSAMYVRHNQSDAHTGGERHGIMLLCEAAMGTAHEITVDDGSLVKAPQDFDSVIAKGRTEPDKSMDTHIILNGKRVIVPQGKPVATAVPNSNFSQTEYLVYKESQQRIRYVLRFKF